MSDTAKVAAVLAAVLAVSGGFFLFARLGRINHAPPASIVGDRHDGPRRGGDDLGRQPTVLAPTHDDDDPLSGPRSVGGVDRALPSDLGEPGAEQLGPRTSLLPIP
jgi:hypothetical protein